MILYDLNDDELKMAKRKNEKINQIAFASLFKHFQIYKKFPDTYDNQFQHMVEKITIQLKGKKTIINWQSRTIKRYKQEIRNLFSINTFNESYRQNITHYLNTFIFPKSYSFEKIEILCSQYFKKHKVEFLSKDHQTRFLKSAYHDFEENLFNNISNMLKSNTKQKIDQFLVFSNETDSSYKTLSHLKKSNVYVNFRSIENELEILSFLNSFEIPGDIENMMSDTLIKKYYNRFLSLSPSHLMDFKIHTKYAMVSIFLYQKKRLCHDGLSDIFIKIIKRLTSKAEKHVDKYIKKDIRRVNGKFETLFLLADTSLKHPKGVIENYIYIAVHEELLKNIITDLGYRESWFKSRVAEKSLSLYTHGNKKVIWSIFESLIMKTDNEKYQRILDAIQWIKTPVKESKDMIHYFDLIAPIWIPFIKKTNEDESIEFNVNALECALFERLILELSVKNIWVMGSYCYRDYKKDLPFDFDKNKDDYFDLLEIPKTALGFIERLKKDLNQSLTELNDSVLKNDKVRISKRKNNKGAIKITPYVQQAPPLNIHVLQKEITLRWGAVSLLDILKETDLRIGFSKKLRSVSSCERIPIEDLTRRKLFCIYGLGTNMGLKRVVSGQLNDTLSDLQYVKLRYISKESIKLATQDIINEIIKIRNPNVWGNMLTGCSCDSKKISVWDQNLITEWHLRYGGKGIMIYWHVDKKSLVIYAQSKTCSSSEVGSMMKGVIDHDTNMDMDQIYTDTHGQSSIGFAFSHLLGFELLPRIKNINKQKLYKVSKSDFYENIEDAMASTAINWTKIEKHYENIVKHVIALKTGCVEPSVLLKRLSANNKENPIYQSFLEIGKVIKTIFLCKYIENENLRIEIHESLNIVECVNSVMHFIFYGKLGEISSNDPDQQEISIACLHLLQTCLVYINTLMIQEIIELQKINLTQSDLRALTPLISSHISPYGFFSMDMSKRIIFLNNKA